MHGRFGFTNSIIGDVYEGVLNAAGSEAKVGQRVASWVASNGEVFLPVPGTVAVMEYSRFRPGQKVVHKYVGGFHHLRTNTMQNDDAEGTFTFCGAVDRGVKTSNAAVLVQNSTVSPGSATAGLGLTFRPNWAAEGFSGVDSSVRYGTGNGSFQSGVGGFGAAGAWHSIVMAGFDEGSGRVARAYCGGPVRTSQLATAPAVLDNRKHITVGCRSFDPAAGTYAGDVPMEISHFGLWSPDDITGFSAAAELDAALNLNTPTRKLIFLGDSRTHNLLLPGSVQAANEHGYVIRRTDIDTRGWSSLRLRNRIADVHAGGHEVWDAAVIWIGVNDSQLGLSESFDNLLAIIRDNTESGLFRHVILVNETGANRDRHYDYHLLINDYFQGVPNVTLVNTWDALRDPDNKLAMDGRYSVDGIHPNRAGMGQWAALVMPIIAEHFGDRRGDVFTTRNAASLTHEKMNRSVPTAQEIADRVEIPEVVIPPIDVPTAAAIAAGVTIPTAEQIAAEVVIPEVVIPADISIEVTSNEIDINLS